VTRSLDNAQAMGHSDISERRVHFGYGSKRIRIAVNEQYRRSQFGEVCGAELVRLSRRMQRIREQKQPVR
jgi:hypothetical protein